MTLTSARAAGAPSWHRAAVTWIGLLTLLLSLLTPLLTLEAAAQGVPPTCDPGYVISDDGTACVADPNAQPAEATATETTVATEEPTVEIAQPTVAATEQPAAETYRLTITVYRCDHPSFDPSFSDNLQLVLNQCVGPGSGTFNIESTVPVPQQSGGALEFQIGPGLAIQELLQPGYGNPIANCFLYDAGGNLVDQIGPGEASGGGWKIGSVAGDVHCDWYQVDRGIGSVYIVNMACPAPLASPLPTLDEMVATCTAPAGPILFGIQYGQIQTQTGTSGGEFNDVDFENVSTGPIAIWAEPPATFDSARLFCQLTTSDGAEISPFAEIPVSDFRATDLSLAHNQRLHCSWFNIPAGPGLEQPQPTQTPGTAPSDLTVALHTCPPGYDPMAAGANPNIDCPPGPNGVTFTLADTDPATTDLQTNTGDSVDNAVTFGGLAPGDYTVTETVPEGMASTFVLGCGGGGIDPIPTVVDGPFAITLPPGVVMTCPWFNVPAPNADQRAAAAIPGTASLTMAVYNCPPGFDVSTVDANPIGSCTPVQGIELDMDDSIDDGAGRVFTTDATGTSTIDKLGADTYAIVEGARGGTTATFVWDCYDAAGASARTDPLSMGTTLIYTLADTARIRCDWFNVVGGTGRVIVNSHACATNVSAYTLTYEQLGTACALDPGTIAYTVVSDTHQETQPASQTPLTLASFANVPTGYAAVVEEINTTWTVPVVWCQVNLEDATQVSPPTRLQVYVGRQVNFQLDPGQVVYCDWYNVGRGNTQVTIANHACPSGFDPYTADPATLANTCNGDPGTNDVTIEDGGLYLETKPAVGSNPLVFYPTPSGQLRISQKLPATLGLPVVVCRVDYETTTNVLPYTSIPVGNGPSITMSLSPGQQLACDWYNTGGGLGMVSIWTQACPEGLDPRNLSPLQLEQRCTDDIETIDYTLASGSFRQTASSTNLFRYADFPAVPAGGVTVTGALPHGSDTPIVYCRVQQEGQPVTKPKLAEVTNGSTITWPLEAGQWLICQWYNLVDTGSTVTVVKWICPDGAPYDQPYEWYAANCTRKHAGVDFTLTHSGGAVPGTTDANGQIQWPDVPLGPFSIQEQIPKDYGEPVVFCSAGTDVSIAQVTRVNAPGGYLTAELTTPRTFYSCNWFNIYPGPGKVTIHKYTCPPGYDLHAAGADPTVDCATATNGVAYTLVDADPATPDQQGATGDAGQGAVTFGDLAPGTWTATETVPPNTALVFVLDCTGGKMGAIRSYPLSTGASIDIPVGAGEAIECTWYNVPNHDDGRLTVIKYRCATMTYTSDVDCEIDEGGRTFDLLAWNGSGWDIQSTRTTDGAGRATFDGLAPGQYWLDEQGSEWCHLTSDRLASGGDRLDVQGGQETVVSIYNCGSSAGEVGKVGKTPTKYPNTGVGPRGTGPATPLPALAPLSGLLALLAGRRRSRARKAAASQGNRAMTAELTRRQVVAGLGLPLLGSLALGRSIFAQGDPPAATPNASPVATPDRLCLPATPAAGGEADCVRGPVPAALRIDAIGVDAPIEVLEVVGGVMQQPTDEKHVAWYKESARLGETGNLWLAGHVNWWTTPIAVFTDLGRLREGDDVALLDADGKISSYAVAWVRQESNLEPPREEVLGMTDHPAVTLITCSGEWNADISEYDQRTVVRADLVDQPEA